MITSGFAANSPSPVSVPQQETESPDNRQIAPAASAIKTNSCIGESVTNPDQHPWAEAPPSPPTHIAAAPLSTFDEQVVAIGTNDEWTQAETTAFTSDLAAVIGHKLDSLTTEGERHRLETAVEQAPLPAYFVDKAGEIEYVNEAFADLTGYDSGEVIGESPMAMHAEDSDFPRSAKARHPPAEGVPQPPRTTESGWNPMLFEPWEGQVTVEGKYGEKTVSEQIIPVRQNGGFEGYVVTMDPRDSGQNAKEQLIGIQTHLQTIHETFTNSEKPFAERVEKLLKQSCEHIGFGAAVFAKYDDTTEMFSLTASYIDKTQMGDFTFPDKVPAGQTYAEKPAKTGDLSYFSHFPESKSHLKDRAAYQEWGIEAHLCTPVKVEGDVIGVICLMDAEPVDDVLSKLDRSRLEIIADWIAYEVSRRRRETELKKANKQLEATNEQLLEAKKRLEVALEATQSATWEISFQSDTPMFNATGLETVIETDLPFPMPAPLDTIRKFIHRDDLDMVETPLTMLMGEKEYYHGEVRVWTGEDWVWVNLQGRLIESGESPRLVGTVTNIDEYKRQTSGVETLTDRFSEFAEVNSQPQLARVITDMAIDTVGCDICTVYQRQDEDTIRVVNTGLSHEDIKISGVDRQEFSASSLTPVVETLQTGDTLTLTKEAHESDRALPEEIQSAHYVPLSSDVAVCFADNNCGFEPVERRDLAELLASIAQATSAEMADISTDQTRADL